MSVGISLSSTGVSDASKCMKAFQYHMVDKLISRPENISKAIRRGIWLHRCLQDYHIGKDWQKSLARLMGQALAWGLDGDAMQEIYDECRLLMLSYTGFWHDEGWEVVADEKEYKGTFGNVELRATLDTLVKIPNHGVVIVEHKSTSDIPPAAWRAIDPQTALQIVVAAANGIRVDEVLFNYIDTTPKVPRITQKNEFHGATGATTSAHFQGAALQLMGAVDPKYIDDKRAEYVNDARFFQRFYVQRQPELIRETMLDVRGIADRVLRAQALGHYPRSLNVFTCKPCFYAKADLCAVEYVKGGISEVIRSEHFQHDNGYREGNVV